MAGSYAQRTDAVHRFIQTSDDLFRRPNLAVSNPSTGAIPEFTANYQELVEKARAAASPELQAFAARLQEEYPVFLNATSAKRCADVPGEIDRTLGALKGKLTNINTHLDKVAKDANDDFEKLSKTASSDFKAAIEKLMPLAKFIQGDWKYSAGEALKAEALCTDIDKVLETASKSAKATADKMRYYEGAFSQIRDAELLGMEHGLQNDMKKFKTDIDSRISGTFQQLEVLNRNLEDNRNTLRTREQNLTDATARYDKAVQDAKSAKAGETAAWILCWPVGLALHFTVSQSFMDDVSNAQNLVTQAKVQQEQVQRDISSTQASIGDLQDIERHFQQFQVDYTVLETSVAQAAAAGEIRKRASNTMVDETISTWGRVKAAENSASAAGSALTKAQYANIVLETLDKARFEKSIKENALDILNDLKSHDSGNSVTSIPAPLLPGQSFLQTLLAQYSQM